MLNRESLERSPVLLQRQELYLCSRSECLREPRSQSRANLTQMHSESEEPSRRDPKAAFLQAKWWKAAGSPKKWEGEASHTIQSPGVGWSIANFPPEISNWGGGLF